jgi:hypothetical protein
MSQLSLLEYRPTGPELKADALAVLERHYSTWLERARETARHLCRLYGETDIEAVTEALRDDPAPHPNAKGAVFKGSTFEACGFKAAKHPEAHGRWIRCWQIKQ